MVTKIRKITVCRNLKYAQMSIFDSKKRYELSTETFLKVFVLIVVTSDQSGRATPVPIPNTEVKPSSDLGCTVEQTGNPGRC